LTTNIEMASQSKTQFKKGYLPHNKTSLYFPDTNEKICNDCNRRIDINLFPKRPESSDGHYSICKECVSLRNKAYKDKQRKIKKTKLEEQYPGAIISEFSNSLKKAYFFPDTNEKICAKCDKKFHISNFFRHSATQDGFHSWCKSCCKDGNQKSRQKKYATFEGRITTLLNTCKKSSISRGNQEMSLTRENLLDMWNNQNHKCYYSNVEMNTQPNLFNSVSIERINSSIGYTKDNCVLVCNVVNRMKSDIELNVFIKMCKEIAKNN